MKKVVKKIFKRPLSLLSVGFLSLSIYGIVDYMEEKYANNSSQEYADLEFRLGAVSGSEIPFPSVDTSVLSYTPPTNIGDGDGSITLPESFYNNSDSSLSFKIDYSSSWTIVNTGVINNLTSGTYNFRWSPKISSNYYPDNSIYYLANDFELYEKITASKNFSYETSIPTTINSTDGSITLKNWHSDGIVMQYRVKSETQNPWVDIRESSSDWVGWIILSNLGYSIYEFRVVGKNNEYFLENNTQQYILATISLKDVLKTILPTTVKPEIIPEHETSIDGNNGRFVITKWSSEYSQLQYTKITDEDSLDTTVIINDDSKEWLNIEGYITSNIGPGEYRFRWTPKDDTSYVNDEKYLYAGYTMIKTSRNIPLPNIDGVQYIYKNISNADGKNNQNGYIRIIGDIEDAYSQLFMRKVDDINPNEWVLSEREQSDLGVGTYEFQWMGRDGENYVDPNDKYNGLSSIPSKTINLIIDNRIYIPIDPSWDIVPVEVKGEKSYVTFKDWKDPYSFLQYSTTFGDWTTVTSSETRILAGQYTLRWIGKNGEQYDGSGVKEINLHITISIEEGQYIYPPSIAPKFEGLPPTAEGLSNGVINIENYEEKYSILEYRIQGDETWLSVHNSSIEKLKKGIYEFRWVGKKDEEYYIKDEDATIITGIKTIKIDSINLGIIEVKTKTKIKINLSLVLGATFGVIGGLGLSGGLTFVYVKYFKGKGKRYI